MIYLDKHNHCQIERTLPISGTINDVNFHALTVKYPQLIYEFDKCGIIAEITIREKQRAVGTQPMLYFCFPITKLNTNTNFIGRIANKNECAAFLFNKDNYFIILEMIKIFGMLSVSYKNDTVEIIKTVLSDL